MNKSALTLAVSAMMLMGVTVSSQNVYAHTFAGDESAAFLLLVESIKVELGLVQSNLASNVTLAEQHAEHAHHALDEHTIEEILERNERIGTDLPAALEELHDSVTDSTEQEVQAQIQDINDLLDETVTIRIEPAQMTNSTVRALVLANMLVSIAFEGEGHYEIAIGIGEEHTHEEAHEDEEHSSSDDEHGEMSNETEESSDTHSMTEGPVEIVDMAHYQTALALAERAQELWTELKTEAPSSAAQRVMEIDAAMPDLVEAINDKDANNDILAIIHERIHPNMIVAFGLKLAPVEGHEHELSKIPEKLMMYADKTGGEIHSDHLAENAPIAAPYTAGSGLSISISGTAMPRSHDEHEEESASHEKDSMDESAGEMDGMMSEEQEMELELDAATWKSSGRVLYIDLTGGSMTVGDETMTVNAGQAYYLLGGRLLYAFAVVTPEGGDASSHQLLGMRAVLAPGTMALPLDGTAAEVEIVCGHGKLGSDRFLELSGSVTHS